MIIGAAFLTALGGSLLATLAYCLIMYAWNLRNFVAMWAFGAIILFVAISGPIKIG